MDFRDLDLTAFRTWGVGLGVFLKANDDMKEIWISNTFKYFQALDPEVPKNHWVYRHSSLSKLKQNWLVISS